MPSDTKKVTGQVANEAEEGETRERTYRVAGHAVAARPLQPALYLVATPIGNLSDISLRALEVLAGADILACEDTRVTRVLIERYGIARRPFAYHEHNAETAGPKLLKALEQGRSVALVSDAGTPLVSDPGYRLATQAIAAGHDVVPVPGASAPLAALVASGLPSDAFLFAGFLPAKDRARHARLAELATVPATLIFFESPHRVATTLKAATTALGGERQAAVCRELTKVHEEISRGTLAGLAGEFAARERVRGEIVLVVGPPSAAAVPTDTDIDALLCELLGEMPPAQAAREAARRTGLDRKALYQRLIALKGAAS